jgi:tRNA(Ile)-lysidine synthase
MKQEPLEQKVLRFIREHLLLTQPQLVVAVSGGPDSVCLLHILFKLKDELGIGLHVAHLNHQLRGADSKADAEYVANLARQLNLPVIVEQKNVRAYKARHHISLEEAAREVRYSFLARVAGSIGTDYVAVGHTRNDNIETILLHLIRGTGTRGLRGLVPLTQLQYSGDKVTVVRPLLEVTREETLDYCNNHHLEPRLDVSNLSTSPLRNRIRHQLIPLLHSYNLRADEALLRTSRIAQEELAFLDKECTRLWPEIVQKQGDSLIFSRVKFTGLPVALQRHMLRMGMEGLIGNLKDIESRHIEEMVSALSKPAGKKLTLPEGVIFAIDYDRYLLGPDPISLSPFPLLTGEFPLSIPGETCVSGWQVRATVTSTPVDNIQTEEPGRFTACFDRKKVGDRLLVHTRRPGDRFQPLGMNDTKKLAEFMIDAKIPSAWRDRIPIVSSMNQVIWVVGWRIDDRVKVTNGTKQVLCLEFERRG